MGTFVENVNTLAARLTDSNVSSIQVVAANAAAITTVSSNIDDVQAVSADMVTITLLSGDLVNVDNVASDLVNIDAVAAGLGNINSVATDLLNINNVAAALSNINSVNTHMSDVINTSTNITGVTTVASNMLGILGVATHVIPNLPEILEADVNAATATSKANEAQLIAWVAEANKLTADSYATEAQDVFVKVYTSNGDGTFTSTSTAEYSSLHWSVKAATLVTAGVIDDTIPQLNRVYSSLKIQALHDAQAIAIATPASASGTTFTPTGGISATTVQAAIAELDTDKAGLTQVLTKVNTEVYAPSSAYHPATKAYVDAMATSGGGNVAITAMFRHVATAGQTSFSATYILGSVSVYLNGVQLDSFEYTAGTGTTIVLAVGAILGDIINIVAYGGADVYNKTQIDTLLGGIGTMLSAKAPINSPSFTGTPTLPTGTIAVTQATGDNSTKVATTAFTKAEITATVSGANVSLSSNGYQKLPSGLILQWGITTSISAGGTVAISLPISFPTAVFTVTVGAPMQLGSSATAQASCTANTVSSFTVKNFDNVAHTYSYVAIGY